MNCDEFRRGNKAPLLIASDPLAARRWEACWLAADGRSAAARPPVHTIQSLAAELVAEMPAGSRWPAVLNGHQTSALWREIVGKSSTGRDLISPGFAAAAAERAWRQLRDWRVPWESLHARGEEADFVALLDWCRVYAGELRRRDWVDEALLIDLLTGVGPGRSRREIAVDMPLAVGPASREWLAGLSAGPALDVLRGPGATIAATEPACRRAPDAVAEIEAAAEWAGRRLQDEPARLLAVIVQDTRLSQTEIESIFSGLGLRPHGATGGNGAGSLWNAAGRPVASFGAPGAALNALDLLFGDGRFQTLSSWLRSPFFGLHADERSRAGRAGLEAELRRGELAQWRFADAMDRGGLRALVDRHLADEAVVLQRALSLARSEPIAQYAGDWLQSFDKVLRALRYDPTAIPAAMSTAGQVEVGDAWDRALRRTAALSAVLGPISAGRALAELQRVAESLTVRSPMTLAGVHLLTRPEQLGPGYSAVWLTGFADAAWPRPMRLNPLLPAALQRAHEMPGATPALAAMRSRQLLDHVLGAAPEVVLSFAAEDGEVPLHASRMLGKQSWAETGGELPYRQRACTTRGQRERCRVADPVPPAAPGEAGRGTRLLTLQARCPVRAFCEVRLHCREIERVRYGISARTRGRLIHKALESIYRPFVAVGPIAPSEVAGRVSRAVRRAIARYLPWSDGPWDLISELETRRTTRAILALLEAESGRSSVDIAAVEQSIDIRIGDWCISGRVDRADRLPDGGVVILDYKTGQPPSVADWRGARLREPQLPAYATAWPEPVAALLVATVDDDRVDFRSAGRLPDDYPVRNRGAPSGEEWRMQTDRWQRQIRELVEEFAAGDVRIDLDRPDLASGAWAPLTRLAALRRLRDSGAEGEPVGNG